MECILATENNPLWGYSNLQGANFQNTLPYILITILTIILFDKCNYWLGKVIIYLEKDIVTNVFNVDWNKQMGIVNVMA